MAINYKSSSRHGSVEKNMTIPPFNKENFIKQSGHCIVVCEKDELLPLLKWDDSCNVDNDAVLLLNSRRLDFADPKTVADIIRNRFAEHNVQSPFDGLTDNEIFMNIKSRHIQSMSELDAYSEYLASSLASNLVSSDTVKASIEDISSPEEFKEV